MRQSMCLFFTSFSNMGPAPIMDALFSNVLISSFLEISRCQIVAYTTVQFSGNGPVYGKNCI